MCGPPAEPLIDFVVTLEVSPNANDIVYASMFNAQGEHVNTQTTSVSSLEGSKWTYSLGDCDGLPQTSGTFAVYAWLDATYDPFKELPAMDAPQGIDMVDVTCSDGCYPARAARISIR